MKSNKLEYFYPILLMIFTLIFLYFFIFGDNGYYAHKKKLNDLYNLKKANKKLYSKISYYKKRIKNLKRMNMTTLEEEARQIPLKKKGEYIVKLYDKEWIKNLVLSYERQMNKELRTSKELNSFTFKYKMIFVLSISLLLAFILTFILPKIALYRKHI